MQRLGLLSVVRQQHRMCTWGNKDRRATKQKAGAQKSRRDAIFGTDERPGGRRGAGARARSRAAGLVTAAGGTAPPAAASYDLPGPVATPRQARDLMAMVDNALVAVYADAAAASAGDDRRWAARTAAANAARAVSWGAASQAFPT